MIPHQNPNQRWRSINQSHPEPKYKGRYIDKWYAHLARDGWTQYLFKYGYTMLTATYLLACLVLTELLYGKTFSVRLSIAQSAGIVVASG